MSPSPVDRAPHFADTPARLDLLNRIYGSDAAVARLLDVDRAQVRRWRGGELPEPADDGWLTILARVVEALSVILSPTSIPKWLEGPNAHLGDLTPMYLLRTGQVADVFAAVDALRSGAYA